MRLNRNRPLVVFLACLVATATGGAWHFLGDRGGDRTAPLTILTPHGDNIRQEIGAAFRAWYQARYAASPEIQWIDQGGTSEDLRYVLARFAKTPGSIGIDLFFGGGTPPFRTLAKAGLLEPRSLPEAVLGEIPPALGGLDLYAPNEGWYAAALSSFGILFNRKILAATGLPEPVSWTDLAHPRAYQWVATVDPRGSGSAHVIYEIILQKYGWEKGWQLLARMAANSSHFTKGASGILPLVSTGEVAYSLAIDQYAWSLMEQLGEDKIGFILPAGETATTPDPVGILKGAPHPLIARRFLEFLFSESCQLLWSLKAGVPGGPARLSLNRMSVLPKVYSKLNRENSFIRGNPFRDLENSGWAYSDSLTEARWSLLNDALGLWMVDSHEEARRAWVALMAGHPGAGADTEPWEREVSRQVYFRPPAPWETLSGMLAKWKDENFRNATLATWARELRGAGKGRSVTHD